MIETKFKDTEIGKIPEEWIEKKLGDIGSLAMCKRIFQDETSNNGDVPFYKIGTFGQQADAYISKEKYEEYKRTYRFPNKGDILISAAGTIGRTVVYDGKPAYFQDSNIVWLAHNENCVANAFLYYVYQRIIWNTEDTTIARLYNNNFNNTIVCIPQSIVEQRRIASALTSVDNLISSLAKLIEKKKNIKQGAMQQLLTGKTRLKGFEGAWVERKLGDIFVIGNGRDYKHLKSGCIPVYGTGGLMTYVNNYLNDGETVCIGRKGTIDIPQYHVGKIWTVDTLFYTYNFNNASPKFLYYLFWTIDWYAYNTSTGVPSLTAQNISSINVMLPSLKEQHAIATILTKMDDEITSLEAKKAKYEAVKQGMMQQLLTGKLRLIG